MALISPFTILIRGVSVWQCVASTVFLPENVSNNPAAARRGRVGGEEEIGVGEEE